MKRVLAGVVIAALGTVLSLGVVSAGNAASARPEMSAEQEREIREFRNAGASGLRAILDRYGQHPNAAQRAAIDAVAGQRDASWSGLYWYTDLDRAKELARAEMKPILYLRLLGKLTDEYSCANSRFFRTVLYANEKVSGLLRDEFVLVWESERPVPVVTIDYGDGRELKRTLTGNSIHYVLDCQGRVVDALPGLFDPVTFERVVREAGVVAKSGSGTLIRQYREKQEAVLTDSWRVAGMPTIAEREREVVQPRAKVAPDAGEAARVTVSKTAVELPVLRSVSPASGMIVDASSGSTNDEKWKRLAAHRAAEARLDFNSVALIQSQNSALADAEALRRTVERLELLVAEDSVRNDYDLRRRVLGWMREAGGTVELEKLNRRVYSELFLTPREDPWLGLVTQDGYSGLVDDGRVQAGQ